jgi:hypothetical protein
MFCVSCGSNIPEQAKFCPSCGTRVSSSPSVGVSDVTLPTKQSSPFSDNLKPFINKEFREKLLECYLGWSTSQELSDWLKDMGQDPNGTIEEKRIHIIQNIKYLSFSPEEFYLETLRYLQDFSRSDILAHICETLGLDNAGTKEALFRRIYREVGYKEGWLSHISKDTSALNKQIVLPFVKWYPILKNRNYEKDYYEEFFDEMSEIFGKNQVHEQLPIAHGNILKIDFHIGHPHSGGVGAEFKMPANNSEIQKALGQMDQYLRCYGSNLIVVLIPDFIDVKAEMGMVEELRKKGIETVIKQKKV